MCFLIKLGRHVNHGKPLLILEVTVQRWRSRWLSFTNVGCAGMLRFALLYFVLVHLSGRLKCTIVITSCPSSIRPSVRRQSSLTFHIFYFFSETAKRNSTKLDREQDLNVLYQVCVFKANRETRWPPWALIGRDIFDFSSETAEDNSTKLDRKHDLNVLYQVSFCVACEA